MSVSRPGMKLLLLAAVVLLLAGAELGFHALSGLARALDPARLEAWIGMLPLTFAYSAVGEVVLGSRWARWIGGAVMLALFFLLPWWIERYDLFSMRKLFQHPESPDAGPAPSA